jgi:hypothetical protein
MTTVLHAEATAILYAVMAAQDPFILDVLIHL